MTRKIRCPSCGHFVEYFFQHIDIDCEHDMTKEQIAELERQAAELPTEQESWSVG